MKRNDAIPVFSTRIQKTQFRKLLDINKKSVLYLFLIVFLVNFVYSLFMKYPIVSDEYITMSEGFYLWGSLDLSTLFTSLPCADYYGYGYSALYGFIYYFTQDLGFIYKLILCLNTLIISLIPVFAFKISVEFLNIRQDRAFWISLFVGLFPANVIVSKFATNDTMLFFLPWLVGYIFLYIFNTDLSIWKQSLLCAVLGFLSTYAYTVHGRGLVMIAVAFIYLLILVLKTKPWIRKIASAVSFIAVAICVYYLNELVKGYLITNLFGRDSTDTVVNTSESVLFQLQSIWTSLDTHSIFGLLQGLVGQLFYILSSTFGLALIAFVVFFRVIKDALSKNAERAKKNLGLCLTFMALLTIATLIVSVLFFSNIYVTDEVRRADYYLYGRYAETTLSGIIFCVAIFYSGEVSKEQSGKVIIPLFLAAMVGGAFTVWFKTVYNDAGVLRNHIVSGIMPFGGFGSWEEPITTNYVILSLIISIIFFSCWILWNKQRKRIVFSILLACFVYSSGFSMISDMIPMSQKRYKYIEPLNKFEDKIVDLSVTYENVYVIEGSYPRQMIQYAMPDFQVQYLDISHYGNSELNKIKPNSFIISESDKNLDELYKKIYFIDKIGTFNIWVYGEQIKTALEQKGIEYSNRNKFGYIQLSPKNLFVLNGEKTDSEITIDVGGIQYGPYTVVLPAKYEVAVYGSNLDVASVDVFADGTIINPNILEQDSSHILYEVELFQMTYNCEFRTINQSYKSVGIKGIFAYISDDWNKIDIKDSYKLTEQDRIYLCIYDDDNAAFWNNINTEGPCLVSQTGIQIMSGGYITAQELFFNPGKYRITVLGKQLANGVIDMDAEGNIVVSNITTTDESVTFEMETNDYLKHATLELSNAEADVKMIFNGIKIEAIENYS